jgi:hypothetical protein
VRPARASLVLALLLGVAVALPGTAAAQSRVSVEEFADRLDRAIELADEGAAEPSVVRMEEVRRALGLPAEVILDEGAVLIPPDPLLEGLSGEAAADFRRASAHLEATREALQEALARDAPVPGEVDEALERAFRGVVQIQPTLLDRIRRAVSELISWFLHRLGNFVGRSSVAAWVVLAMLLVAVLFLLRRARLVPERVVPAGGPERAADSNVDWRRRAQEALHGGDLREAIRALYLALITTLAGRGLLADAPALTAGECRAAVRQTRPTLYPLVARATESYERVLYGGAAPREGDVRTLLEAEAGARSA